MHATKRLRLAFLPDSVSLIDNVESDLLYLWFLSRLVRL